MKSLLTLFLLVAAGCGRSHLQSPSADASDIPIQAEIPDAASLPNCTAICPNSEIPHPHKPSNHYDVLIRGTFIAATHLPARQTRVGDWFHRHYHIRYKVDEVLKGHFRHAEVSFVVIRRVPTPESGIMLKEYWPFSGQRSQMFFYLSKSNADYIIQSLHGIVPN